MEAVGRLAGGVAHDFNNLLMAIMGYGELIRSSLVKDDPLYKYSEDILKATERAASLTQQLLAFSRRQVMQTQVLNLNRVAADLEKMLGRLIGEHIDLDIVAGPDLGAVKADPGQISRQAVDEAVGFQGYPTTLLLDRRGEIRGLWSGFRPGDEAEMRQLIVQLLKET